MTALNIQAEIRQLLSSHMAKIQDLMSEAQSKKTEAIFAGFTANREEQRKGQFEGEIAMWQSKLSAGETADNYVNQVSSTSGLFLQKKIQHKIEKLKEKEKNILSLLSSLKERLEQLTKAIAEKQNPLLLLAVILFELMTKMLENTLNSVQREKAELAKQVALSMLQNSGNMAKVDSNIENQKALEAVLLKQSNVQKNSAMKMLDTVDNRAYSFEQTDRQEKNQGQLFLSAIMNLKQKLENKGIEIPADSLVALQDLIEGKTNSKVIIDQSISEKIYEDIVKLVGEDNIVIDRRNEDRRNETERRSDHHIVLADSRSDVAGRRTGDRRQDASIFIG